MEAVAERHGTRVGQARLPRAAWWACSKAKQGVGGQIRREIPRNAKELLAAFGKCRTRYDARLEIFRP